MMKKFVLILMLLLMFSCTANAVIIPYTEDFTDSTGFLFTGNPPPGGIFNGSGQFEQTGADQIFRVGQAGDAFVQMDMDITVELNASWVIWTYQLVDNVLGTRFQMWLQKGAIDVTDNVWLYMNDGTTTTAWTSLGAVTEFAFEYDWVEATGAYNVSYAANGGAMTPWYSDTGVVGGTSVPVEYMYAGGAGVAGLDNYSVGVIPEPATMLLLGLGGLMIRRKRALS